MRAQIHELHERLRFTAIFVTHDQSEALALGDRLAIMRAGVIEQFDTPERIFEEPATEYVAGFIGMSNRLPLERSDGVWTHEGLPLTGGPSLLDAVGSTVFARVRPDAIGLAAVDAPTDPAACGLRAIVIDSEYGGRHMDVIVAAGGNRLHARVPTGERGSWARTLAVGQDVMVSFRPGEVVFFDDQGRPVECAPHPLRTAVGA